MKIIPTQTEKPPITIEFTHREAQMLCLLVGNMDVHERGDVLNKPPGTDLLKTSRFSQEEIRSLDAWWDNLREVL